MGPLGAARWPGSRVRLQRQVPSATDIERFAGLPHRSLPGGLTVVEANAGKSRRRGLSRLDSLPGDHALLIPKCPSVHTFGMRFALDLIWLGKGDAVVRVDRDVRPRRMRICTRARSVVETVAGEANAFLSAGLAAEPDTPGAADR
jgi:uncharacterized membrane protein (UPF0127 family)